MADFLTCYNWMMNNEDPLRVYAKVGDVCPRGCKGPCFAISGINSGEYPVEFSAIEGVLQANRGAVISHFYQTNFWNDWFAQMTSDLVAKRVFDEAINAGEWTAVKLLQRAVSSLGTVDLTVDGVWGPNTLNAVNSSPEADLIQAYKDARLAYYQSLASWATYQKVWQARALQ